MVDRPPQGAPPQGAPIDRYVVLEYLAEGGMGAIYLGKKLGAGGFEKEVVLKQLLPEFTRQPEFIDLFLREARLSATLDHANIVRTIDLVTAGDEYFIVMEHVDGADLRTLLKRAKRRRKRFSAAAALFLAREVLSALTYAHAKLDPKGDPLRLIHRDVSPSNILISGQGEVKLTDFGIAKASTHDSVFYRVKGKIGYMSPEQARNDPLDARSDLYSLAVCAWEMMTGERLFVRAGITSSAAEIYQQAVTPPSRKVPGLPHDLDRAMAKALALEPAARYQSAGELQEALLRVAHRGGLMMSAPEMAHHLREICGDKEEWRNLDAGTETGTAVLGGTEMYDLGGGGTGSRSVSVAGLVDEPDELDEVIDAIADLRGGGPLTGMRRARGGTGVGSRAHTGLTDVSRLQAMELTSMIHLGAVGHAGAEPLVDLDGPVEPPRRLVTDEPLPRLHDSSDDSMSRSLSPLPLPFRPESIAETERVERVELEAERETGAAAAPARRRRLWLVLLAILLAGVGITLAIGFTGPGLHRSPPPPRRAPPAPAAPV